MSRTELVDVIDETGEVIATVTRAEAEQDGQISATVLVFIFDEGGRLWVQLRPQTKHHFPGLWDITACGALLTGEDPLVGAARELAEETGLTAELSHVESFLHEFASADGAQHRRMSQLYVGVSAEVPKAGPEVDEFKLWDPADLMEDIEENPEAYTTPFMVELEKALG